MCEDVEEGREGGWRLRLGIREAGSFPRPPEWFPEAASIMFEFPGSLPACSLSLSSQQDCYVLESWKMVVLWLPAWRADSTALFKMKVVCGVACHMPEGRSSPVSIVVSAAQLHQRCGAPRPKLSG